MMFFMLMLYVYTYAIVGMEIWGLPECGDWSVTTNPKPPKL